MLGKQEKDKRGHKEVELQVQKETGLTPERGTETLLSWSPLGDLPGRGLPSHLHLPEQGAEPATALL